MELGIPALGTLRKTEMLPRLIVALEGGKQIRLSGLVPWL
jgi:hypothetical protein